MGASIHRIGGIAKPDSNREKSGIEPGPRGVDRLTDLACRTAKPDPGKGVRKLTDGKGLYLAVMPNGSKLWRMKYRHGGKERVYSIGQYDEIGLADARAECDRAREWLRDGKDPTIERRLAQATERSRQGITFALVAEEWIAKQKYSAGHAAAQRRRLDDEVLPHLGALPVADITPPIVLECLRRIERRGALETTAKCRRMVGQIFRFAVATSRATSDPSRDLSDAFETPDTQHRATIPLGEMPELFKAIAAVPAEANTKLAFYWLLLTCARTQEMRFATWGEIHGTKWRIPAARMKMRLDHVVPLSKQAQTIIALARPLRRTPDAGALLFPGFTAKGSLSENALLALLARAGFYGRQTTHGFRSSFSTWANEEHAADPDVIEACLAHVQGGVRQIYNRAQYLPQRAALLQAWADQCGAWGMKLP